MGVKYEIESVEGLSEAEQKLYAKGDDGKFRLAVDDLPDVAGLKKKNGELIAENRRTKDEISGLKKTFEGLDVDAVKALLTKAATDEDTKLIAEGKFDAVLDKRTSAMKEAHKKDLQREIDARASIETKAAKLAARALAGEVAAVAAKANVERTALGDVTLAAAGIFTLDDDGKAVAKDQFDANGDPLTLAKWLEGLREEKPHWWPRAHGTGAASGGGAGGAGTAKSWQDAKTPAEKAALLARKGVGQGG